MLDIGGRKNIKRRAVFDLMRQIGRRAVGADDTNPVFVLEGLGDGGKRFREVGRRGDVDLGCLRGALRAGRTAGGAGQDAEEAGDQQGGEQYRF